MSVSTTTTPQTSRRPPVLDRSFGTIACCAIRDLTGRGREVRAILYVVAALLVARDLFLAT
ncbi:hypothetical protein [Georgenia alba]|uniref:Uncharacterized protein n=1 Tax=Georgenia alba TaxID=2233858 RepID=A0ABW2QC93_9MICO